MISFAIATVSESNFFIISYRASAPALSVALGTTDIVGYGGFLAASLGGNTLRLFTK
jgi:hypothetical protein